MRWNNLQFLHGTVSVWYHIEGRAHIANQPHNLNSSVSGPQTHNIHVSEPHNLYLASASVSEPQREHQVLSQPNPIRSSALCRPGHTRALPGLFRIMSTHITRTGCNDSLYSICMLMHAQTYIQCSDKICFLNLCIKYGEAKSCPRTHTALQLPVSKLNNLLCHNCPNNKCPTH